VETELNNMVHPILGVPSLEWVLGWEFGNMIAGLHGISFNRMVSWREIVY